MGGQALAHLIARSERVELQDGISTFAIKTISLNILPTMRISQEKDKSEGPLPLMGYPRHILPNAHIDQHPPFRILGYCTEQSTEKGENTPKPPPASSRNCC
jgi:hypothetical protein